MNPWFTAPPPPLLEPHPAGRMAPVFWEPIPLSGERYCLVIVGYGGGKTAAATLIYNQLRCLGDMGHSLAYFGSQLADDFRREVARGTPPEQWRPRFSGMHVGTWTDAFGQSLEAATSGNMEAFSALWRPAGSETDTIAAPRPLPKELRRFITTIKSRVERINSNLATLFEQHYSLTQTQDKAKSTVDYLSSRYAACYSVLKPKSPHARLYANDSLWRLARARDIQLVPPTTTEVVLWVPDPDLPLFSEEEIKAADEHVAELRAEARKEDLSIATVTNADAAAKRLILAEGISQ